MSDYTPIRFTKDQVYLMVADICCWLDIHEGRDRSDYFRNAGRKLAESTPEEGWTANEFEGEVWESVTEFMKTKFSVRSANVAQTIAAASIRVAAMNLEAKRNGEL